MPMRTQGPAQLWNRFNACSTKYGLFALLGVSYAELGFESPFPSGPLEANS